MYTIPTLSLTRSCIRRKGFGYKSIAGRLYRHGKSRRRCRAAVTSTGLDGGVTELSRTCRRVRPRPHRDCSHHQSPDSERIRPVSTQCVNHPPSRHRTGNDLTPASRRGYSTDPPRVDALGRDGSPIGPASMPRAQIFLPQRPSTYPPADPRKRLTIRQTCRLSPGQGQRSPQRPGAPSHFSCASAALGGRRPSRRTKATRRSKSTRRGAEREAGSGTPRTTELPAPGSRSSGKKRRARDHHGPEPALQTSGAGHRAPRW